MQGEFNNQVIQLAQKLISVNSYEVEGKIELMNYVKELLEKEANAKVNLYDMDSPDPYLVAEYRCKDPEYKILLSGHLDVVTPEGMEDPFNPVIKDGVLLGRGSADMKSGCAAQIISFIESTKLKEQKGDIYLVYTTDEEYAAKKIKVALENKHIPKCDFCIVSEPTSNQLGVAHKGEAWIDVEFTGKSAHSSVPHEGINAIYLASEFISKVEEYGKTAYDEYPELPYGKPTIGVGVIHGGTDANVVPHQCALVVDKRYPPGHTLEMFIKEVNDIIDICKKENKNFKAVASVKDDWPPVMFSTDTEIFKKVKEAINSTCETPSKTVNLPYWAEGGFIQMYDIPVLYYGPGSIDYAHNPNERVSIDEVIEAAKGIYAVLKEFCY